MSDKPDGQGLTVDIVVRSEWETILGHDKTLGTGNLNTAPGASAGLTYVVPTGKTLYVVSLGALSYATNAADAEKKNIFDVSLYNQDTSTYLCRFGGDSGVLANLSRLLVVPSAQTLILSNFNRSNHNCDIYLYLFGYEV